MFLIPVSRKKLYTQKSLKWDNFQKKYYVDEGNGFKKYFNFGDKLTIELLDGEKYISIKVTVSFSKDKKQFPKGYCLMQKGFKKGLWFEDVDRFVV